MNVSMTATAIAKRYVENWNAQAGKNKAQSLWPGGYLERDTKHHVKLCYKGRRQ